VTTRTCLARRAACAHLTTATRPSSSA
jgi:hypothetical protein